MAVRSASSARPRWCRTGHTTPSPQEPLKYTTITHPHHPFSGQTVEIVSIGRGIDPDLIVKLPDGRHLPIALTGTDYARLSSAEPPVLTSHRLDIEGLRQIRGWLDARARHQRNGSPRSQSPASSPPTPR